jgi:uncharacterized glyoxalase superfamily protein PhnB
MSTQGVEGVYLETRSWDRAAKFFQALGFEVEFSNGHGTGMLRNSSGGPYLLISEIQEDRRPEVQGILKVADADEFRPDAVVEVVTPFEETHYGTKRMTIRDPDGRVWSIEAQLGG